MSRIAIANFLIGFVAISIAFCGGFFLATDAERAFLYDPSLMTGWQYTLLKSAHGHLNLFAYLHILFGLTLPYTSFSQRVKVWQSIGFAAGTIAMGGLLFLRAYDMPTLHGVDWLGGFIGVCLSATLASLLVHSYGLLIKLRV